jgi:hypothetical protein
MYGVPIYGFLLAHSWADLTTQCEPTIGPPAYARSHWLTSPPQDAPQWCLHSPPSLLPLVTTFGYIFPSAHVLVCGPPFLNRTGGTGLKLWPHLPSGLAVGEKVRWSHLQVTCLLRIPPVPVHTLLQGVAAPFWMPQAQNGPETTNVSSR